MRTRDSDVHGPIQGIHTSNYSHSMVAGGLDEMS